MYSGGNQNVDHDRNGILNEPWWPQRDEEHRPQLLRFFWILGEGEGELGTRRVNSSGFLKTHHPWGRKHSEESHTWGRGITGKTGRQGRKSRVCTLS